FAPTSYRFPSWSQHNLLSSAITRDWSIGSMDPTQRIDRLSQAGDRRTREKFAQGHVHARCGAQPGNESCGHKGMAAKIEEIVRHSEIGPAQYSAKDGEYGLFCRGFRRDSDANWGSICLGGPKQRLAIKFAICSQWQELHFDEMRWYHVLWELPAQNFSETIGVNAS